MKSPDLSLAIMYVAGLCDVLAWFFVFFVFVSLLRFIPSPLAFFFPPVLLL